MFARIENSIVVEYPVAEHDIRERFPMTSFTTDFHQGSPMVMLMFVRALRPQKTP
jgi:hypothetical protein